MNNTRLNLLLQYHLQEPDDPFNIYALAIEYLGEEPEKSKAYFDVLLEKHEDYLPTYYHAARFYSHTDRQYSEKIYEKGIALAQAKGNAHALRELRNAYNEFLFDEED